MWSHWRCYFNLSVHDTNFKQETKQIYAEFFYIPNAFRGTECSIGFSFPKQTDFLLVQKVFQALSDKWQMFQRKKQSPRGVLIPPGGTIWTDLYPTVPVFTDLDRPERDLQLAAEDFSQPIGSRISQPFRFVERRGLFSRTKDAIDAKFFYVRHRLTPRKGHDAVLRPGPAAPVYAVGLRSTLPGASPFSAVTCTTTVGPWRHSLSAWLILFLKRSFPVLFYLFLWPVVDWFTR